MFDLGLNTFAEEEYSSDGILIVDSEPTYEELVEINNELYRELYFMKYEQFEKEVHDGFEMFTNAFVACEYVQRNGIDEHITELIGNEGLLADIKDVIVKFAKWLFGIIQKFIKWIGSLFTGVPKSVSNESPMQAAVLLVRGTSADKQKIKTRISQIAKQKHTSSKELKEGDTRLPSGPNVLREFLLPKNKSRIIHLMQSLSQCIHEMHHDLAYADLSKAYEFVDEVITLMKSDERIVSDVNDVGNYIIDLSDNAEYLRRDLNIMYDKLKRIKPLSSSPTEDECKRYIVEVSKQLNVVVDVTVNKQSKLEYSTQSKNMQNKINAMFRVFRKCYTLEAHVINHLKPLVTCMYGLRFTTGEQDKDTKQFTVLAGAIDVKVKLPQDLLKRIQDAWKCDLININRIIITSTRATANSPGLSGYAPHKILKSGHVPSKDIIMSYATFKSAVWFKEDQEDYKQRLKDQNIDADKYHVNVEPDRAKSFLITLVHETRHIYQRLKKIYTKDLDKTATNHKEYLEFEHEMDARKAAANFVFKQSDIEWVEAVLNRCIHEEAKILAKHWN